MSSLSVLFLVFSGSECVVNTENLVLALVQTTIKCNAKMHLRVEVLKCW